MLETIVKQEIIFYVMGVLMLFGILAKMISHVTVRRMVKAASEIQKSNHRLMRLVKAKFEHASMISDKVQNVEAFVDKYIYEYKVFGCRLGSWRSVPKKVLWIIGILGVFASFESYRMGGVDERMLQYVQWTGIYIMFLLLLGFVAEETTRLDAAKNYMVEYLENVCVHRYAKLNHAKAEVPEEAADEEKQETPEETEEKTRKEEKKSNEQQLRIRAILEEFLA